LEGHQAVKYDQITGEHGNYQGKSSKKLNHGRLWKASLVCDFTVHLYNR
jgi:hypothetical protein